MGYYDIDDMLTESSEIPCKFLHDIPGLGYLENNPGKPIKANAKLMLPYWLAHILAVVDSGSIDDNNNENRMDDERSVPFIEMSTPESFSQKVTNAIKTDPVSLDLHSINPHFYELALKWCGLYSDKNLSEIVSHLLIQRAQEINNFAFSSASQNKNINSIGSITSSNNINDNKNSNDNSNSSNNNNTHLLASSSFLMTLDELEKQVYKKSHESYKDSKIWMYQNK